MKRCTLCAGDGPDVEPDKDCMCGGAQTRASQLNGMSACIQYWRKEYEGKASQLKMCGEENQRLRASILNQRGDNLCWISDGGVEAAKIIPLDQFIPSCIQYHAQIAGERGILKGGRTIAQLETRIVELEAQLEAERAK